MLQQPDLLSIIQMMKIFRQQLSKYFVVGLFTKVFGSTLFTYLYQLTDHNVILSNFIILFISPPINFILHKKYTFRKLKHKPGSAFRYFYSLLFGFLLDTALTSLLIRLFGQVLVAKMCSTIFVSLLLFAITNLYVFAGARSRI